MLFSRGYAIQMSFKVPDSEKRVAEKAVESFEELVGLIRVANRHMDLIYAPFSKAQMLDPDTLQEYRRVFRKFRDEIKINFEKIIARAKRCILLMSEFSTDTRTTEMMNSFIGALEDVKQQVNRLLPLFSDLEKPTFRDALIAAIDNVKKSDKQLKQLTNDRILAHIETNILAKRWTSEITDTYQDKVYEKLPMVVRLYRERQKALNQPK